MPTRLHGDLAVIAQGGGCRFFSLWVIVRIRTLQRYYSYLTKSII